MAKKGTPTKNGKGRIVNKGRGGCTPPRNKGRQKK